VDLLRCDLAGAGGQARLRADTVVMNPPFGARRRGADLDFLRAAFQARGVNQTGRGLGSGLGFQARGNLLSVLSLLCRPIAWLHVQGPHAAAAGAD